MLLPVMLAQGQAPDPVPEAVEFRHLYTFGSKDGIHPPRLLSRRGATAALGRPEHPYGLGFPEGVAVDARRRVWITDSATNSVHVFDPATGAYREIRKVADVVLEHPAGIVSDAAGRVYVADSAHANVYVFDEAGEFDRPLIRRTEHPLERPTSLALSEDGRTLFVTDPPRNAVVALNREGEVNGVIHLPPEFADPAAIQVVDNQVCVLGGRTLRAGMFSPAGRLRGELRWDGVAMPSAFAFDRARRRYVVCNPRWMTIQVFDPEGRNLGAFGQLGDAVDEMRRVDALHVDTQGLVYVVDSRRGKVLVFTAAAADKARPAATSRASLP